MNPKLCALGRPYKDHLIQYPVSKDGKAEDQTLKWFAVITLARTSDIVQLLLYISIYSYLHILRYLGGF